MGRSVLRFLREMGMFRAAWAFALLIVNFLPVPVGGQSLSRIHYDWALTLTDRLTTAEGGREFGTRATFPAETVVPWMLDGAPAKYFVTVDSFRYRFSLDMVGGIGTAAAEAAPTLIDFVRFKSSGASQEDALAALADIDPLLEVSRYVFLDALHHDDQAVRQVAERAIAAVRGSSIAIRSALSDVDALPGVDLRFPDQVLAALGSNDPRIRFAGAWHLRRYLGVRSAPQFRERLVTLLNDEDAAVRFAATAALEKNPSNQAIDALFELLGDSKLAVRSAAWRALGALGETAAVRLRECARDEQGELRYACTQALRAAGPRISTAVPELATLTRDPDPRVRAAALTALRQVGTDQAFSALIGLLDTDQVIPGDAEWRPKDEVAHSALFLLEVARKEAFPSLIKGFKDPRPHVRRYVAFLLREISREKQVRIPRELLLRGIDDPQADVRRFCLQAMQNQGVKVPETAIEAALTDHDYSLRELATRVLWKDTISEDLATRAILKALEDTAYGVQAAGMQAAWRRQPPVLGALPIIVGLLDHKSEVVRRAAVEAAGALAAHDQALELVIPLARDPSPLVRANAVRALVRFKGSPERVVPILVDAANDEDYEVRSIASRALVSFERSKEKPKP